VFGDEEIKKQKTQRNGGKFERKPNQKKRRQQHRKLILTTKKMERKTRSDSFPVSMRYLSSSLRRLFFSCLFGPAFGAGGHHGKEKKLGKKEKLGKPRTKSKTPTTTPIRATSAKKIRKNLIRKKTKRKPK